MLRTIGLGTNAVGASRTCSMLFDVGEYPMTGTSAAEKETPGSRADKLHRGRNVVLAFTMQVGLTI